MNESSLVLLPRGGRVWDNISVLIIEGVVIYNCQHRNSAGLVYAGGPDPSMRCGLESIDIQIDVLIK